MTRLRKLSGKRSSRWVQSFLKLYGALCPHIKCQDVAKAYLVFSSKEDSDILQRDPVDITYVWPAGLCSRRGQRGQEG